MIVRLNSVEGQASCSNERYLLLSELVDGNLDVSHHLCGFGDPKSRKMISYVINKMSMGRSDRDTSNYMTLVYDICYGVTGRWTDLSIGCI